MIELSDISQWDKHKRKHLPGNDPNRGKTDRKKDIEAVVLSGSLGDPLAVARAEAQRGERKSKLLELGTVAVAITSILDLHAKVETAVEE